MTETELLSFVPIIAENAKFHYVGSNNYLVQQEEYGYNISINHEAYNLLKLVDGVRSIAAIKFEYEQIFHAKIPIKSVCTLLYEVLPKYGIIYLENFTVKKKKRELHLFFSFEIFNSIIVDKVVKPLSFLFPHKYFFPILFLLAIFTYTSIITNINVYVQHLSEIFSAKYLLSYILLYFIYVWHEFGHAAAGRRFSCKSKGIGFGFYWIIPVFFSDMSNIWRLKRYERIVVNLGGIYFDLLNTTILLIAYFISHEFIFLVLPSIIALSTLRNLNFFLKFDGYWIVSDLLKIPNLHKSSYKRLSILINKTKNKSPIHFSLKDYFLVSYAVISLLYILILFSILIMFNPNSLLLFPKQFIQFINLLMSNPSAIDISLIRPLIIPSLFIIIVSRKLAKLLTNSSK